MKAHSFPAVSDVRCDRVRVAEGNVAAVDRCDCGMFQLHLAAFTLRLAPEALASLFGTLGQALAVSAASPLGRASASDTRPLEPNADRWSKS